MQGDNPCHLKRAATLKPLPCRPNGIPGACSVATSSFRQSANLLGDQPVDYRMVDVLQEVAVDPPVDGSRDLRVDEDGDSRRTAASAQKLSESDLGSGRDGAHPQTVERSVVLLAPALIQPARSSSCMTPAASHKLQLEFDPTSPRPCPHASRGEIFSVSEASSITLSVTRRVGLASRFPVFDLPCGIVIACVDSRKGVAGLPGEREAIFEFRACGDIT